MKALLFLIPLFLLSCQPTISKNQADVAFSQNSNDPDPSIALQFINDYVAFSNERGKAQLGLVEWVSKQTTVTEHFKKELRSIVEKAEKEDPELGLGFDPIFDAQDYPGNGFELDKLDNKTGYLIVKGIELEGHKVTMKIKLVNGSWLVDGAGIVNIPEGKRSER